MPDITKAQLNEVQTAIDQLTANDPKAKNMMDQVIKLLGLPDKHFAILAPGVLQNFQQSLNNPDDKIAIVQSFNAAGVKAEDVTANFYKMEKEIEASKLPKIKRDFLKEMIASVANAMIQTEGIAKRIIQVPIELCHPDAKMPEYAHISDSGMDVYALEDYDIAPGETKLIPTGIKVAIPVGYELQVRPKSGRALKTKLRVANTPGTIDQGYRDEIKIIVENVEPPIRSISTDFAQSPNDPIPVGAIEFGRSYSIGKGEKFCQLVLAEVPKVAWFEVENIMEVDDEDRGGGFGSSSIYSKEDSRYQSDNK